MHRPNPPSASRFHRFVARCRRAARLGRGGAVALVTAVCAPVLVMIIGFAADLGYASYVNQYLARATDAATLSAVSQTAATAGGGYGNLSYLQTFGTTYFNANVAGLSLKNVNFNLSVVSDGNGGVIATGNYSFSVPTFFSGIIGIKTVPLSGTAKTTAKPLIYVNYYILVDTSQSMGIGSTASDMTKLYNLVVSNNNGSGGEKGCVFGCHVAGPSNSGGLQKVTNEYLAHSNNVTLRIDSAVLAIQSIVNQAKNIASYNQNIAFGFYEMQKNPNNNTLITNVTPNGANPIPQDTATVSTDYASLQTAASNIELGDNQSGGKGDSDFPNELSSFNDMLTKAGITANGTGTSATSPLNYVFIITDGTVDTPGSCPSGHCTSAFDPNNCTALKSKATVGTIYTTYNDIYTNNDPNQGLEGNYAALVKPFVDQIGPNLQSCATSPSYYFPANEGPEIVAAMQSLFAQTQPSSARIAQ